MESRSCKRNCRTRVPLCVVDFRSGICLVVAGCADYLPVWCVLFVLRPELICASAVFVIAHYRIIYGEMSPISKARPMAWARVLVFSLIMA